MIAGDKDRPQTSDEFSSPTLGQQWEWNHNPIDANWSLTAHRGFLRLIPSYADSLLHARNTLTQMMQDDSMEFVASFDLQHLRDGDVVGLSMFDRNTTGIAVAQKGDVHTLQWLGKTVEQGPAMKTKQIQLRIQAEGDKVMYSFSVDLGQTFQPFGRSFTAVFSWWKGARPAIFAFNTVEGSTGNSWVDIDWVHYKTIM